MPALNNLGRSGIASIPTKLEFAGRGADDPDCPIVKPWRFQVGTQPVCVAFHGLCGLDMEIWRISGKCDEYRKHSDEVPCPLVEGCAYLMAKPGWYEVRLCDGTNEMPPEFYPECQAISIDQARLVMESRCYNQSLGSDGLFTTETCC